MGCCTSREAPEQGDDARAGAQPTTSTTTRTAQATNTTATSRTPHARNASTTAAATQSSASSPATRPNKPLRSPSPVPRCPPERALYPWTPSKLAQEREAFFDTRVTGDPAVWTALRHICDSLRGGDVSGAQAVMDAVGLTCPTGRIKSEKSKAAGSGATTRAEERERRKGAVFDASGRGYEIPGWVVSDPLDLAPEPSVDVEAEKLSGEESDEEFEDEDEEVDEEGRRRRRRRSEKGKSREEDIGESLRIRARLSDRGSDVLVDVGDRQKVKVLVRKILEQSGEKNSGKRLRLFVLGKELSEDKTLVEQGWVEGHIVSAMVFGGS